MAATTVIGRLVNPVSALPSSGAVTIVLVDYDDRPVIGFDTADQAEILSTCTVIPDAASGLWTAQLVPNAGIQLADGSVQTAYRVTEAGADGTQTYWVIVTASGSPLWDMENVLISPHCTDRTTNPDWLDLSMQCFVDNFHRYVKGQPLENIVDKKAGY